MPKGQTEAESLDEKIKRIRKKNEEIERRRQEVEADKQTAAKLNALVQLSAPKEDWPLPRSYSPEDDRPKRISEGTREKVKENTRGNVTFKDQVSEANKPPPDPAYRFLADAERDPLPPFNQERPSRPSRGNRGHPAPRGRGRDFRRSDGPHMERNLPGYDAWRAERNRIDEERIQRQRTAQGQWRREWDNQKSEESWESAKNKEQQQQQHQQSYRRPPQTFTPSDQQQPVQYQASGRSEGGPRPRSGEEKGAGGRGGPKGRTPPQPQKTDKGPRGKPALSPSEDRTIQSSGNSIHVSFSTEITSTKGYADLDDLEGEVPPRRTIGSGRLGPPPKPRKSSSSSADDYSQPQAAAVTGPVPDITPVKPEAPLDQRPRLRARRRPQLKKFAAHKSKAPCDGDESWEDADEFSDSEKISEAAKTTVGRKSTEKIIPDPEEEFEEDDCQVTSSVTVETEIYDEEPVFECVPEDSEGVDSTEGNAEMAVFSDFLHETNQNFLPEELEDSTATVTPVGGGEACVEEIAVTVSNEPIIEGCNPLVASLVKSDGESIAESTATDSSLPVTESAQSNMPASNTETNPESAQREGDLSGLVNHEETIAADAIDCRSEIQISEVTTSTFLENTVDPAPSENGACAETQEALAGGSKIEPVGDEIVPQEKESLKAESHQEVTTSENEPVVDSSGSKSEYDTLEPTFEVTAYTASAIGAKEETPADMISSSSGGDNNTPTKELSAVSSTNESKASVLADESGDDTTEVNNEESKTPNVNQACSSTNDVEVESGSENLELAVTHMADSVGTLPDVKKVTPEEQENGGVAAEDDTAEEQRAEVCTKPPQNEAVEVVSGNETNTAASLIESESSIPSTEL